VGTRGWIALLLFALTIGVYAQVRDHEFVNFDDVDHIVENPLIRQGLTQDGLVQAFATHLGGNWIPLTVISLQANASLHGLDPRGFLLTNIFLHALASALLFLALCSLTGATWPSAFTAAVFALHPLHVESVAWAAERKDVLCGVFSMLTLNAYAEYVKRPDSRVYYGLVILSLALALLAKPMAVTLPFVLLLLDFWPLERFRSNRIQYLVKEKIPMFALVAGASIAVWFTQQADQAMTFGVRVPYAYRFLNAFESYVFYVADSVWPSGLGAFYPHPMATLAVGPALLAGLALVAVTVLAVRFTSTRPYLLVGWLWFLGTLIPVIGLVQVGLQARADRYMYFPQIGLCLIVAWGLPDLLGQTRRIRVVLAACGALAIGGLTVATSLQIPHWRDSVAVYGRAIAVTQGNFEAHARLGQSLEQQGQQRDAVLHYREALRLRPKIDYAANNLAWIVATTADASLRDPEEAVRVAEALMRWLKRPRPEFLDTLAASYASAGRFDDAIRTASRAATLAADRPALRAEIERNIALYRKGRPVIDD